MDILQQIKTCTNDEELKELATEAIEYFTNLAHKENKDSSFIGSALDINPLNYHIDELDFVGEKYCDAVNVWNGYIPKGMKIVYGRFYEETLKVSTNRGCYYYVDDDSYIYEFYKYIKNEDINDEYDIIVAAFEFTEKYFNKGFEPLDRESIHKMIYKDNVRLFRPVKEHGFSDFKGNGSAMCTERALMAENLLSVMGLEVIYMFDLGHSYNIYVYHKGEETEIYVLDFSNWVECYNEKFKLVGKTPYMGIIENCNNEMINRVVNEGERLELQDYILYRINGSIYEIPLKQKRSYGTDFALEEEKKLVL